MYKIILTIVGTKIIHSRISSSNMFFQSSPVYFSNRIAMKLLKLNILSKAKLSTQRKTHYDTLQISPNATHNEIKSAYYKLTLQYHPDKNKSDSAREMFQDISNAYEILGNYQSRKQYDRSIAVKHGNVNQMQRPKVMYSEDTPLSSQKHYDFDEWTRAHYSDVLDCNLKRKYMYDDYIKDKEATIEQINKSRTTSKIAIVVCTALFIFMYLRDRYIENDTPLKKKHD